MSYLKLQNNVQGIRNLASRVLLVTSFWTPLRLKTSRGGTLGTRDLEQNSCCSRPLAVLHVTCGLELCGVTGFWIVLVLDVGALMLLNKVFSVAVFLV